MIAATTRIVVILCALCLRVPVQAQSSTDALVYVWSDVAFAQVISSGELIATGRPWADVEAYPSYKHGSVTSFERSPLVDPPRDGYGFVQGLWSPDGSSFAYLTIQPDGPNYRVELIDGEEHRTIVDGDVGPERGYLVPAGWSDDGALILLERFSFYTLDTVRLWRLTGPDEPPTVIYESPIPDLKGNSVALQNGWVFLGFDVVGVVGYTLNINTGQLGRFPTQLALQTPPSVFEIYPIAVAGVVDTAELKAWLNAPAPATAARTRWGEIAPFLSWPLPDHARSITCYPDSEWTDRTHAVECPGLATPREYPGHEGTDIGGRPNGLELGTPVYAAAPGLVVTRNTGCSNEDITCGDAYGNYVLIEHTRVVGPSVQTWYTGYAHLLSVLVEQHAYVRHIGLPIALSGETGLGGAHLHFEVRAPHHPARTPWLDPWDGPFTPDGEGLWIGGAANPSAAVMTAPPTPQRVCRTIDGNNIRRGPGTEYDVVAKTAATAEYAVIQVQAVQTGATPGDWYHIRWDQPPATGWIWAGLMRDCEPPVAG